MGTNVGIDHGVHSRKKGSTENTIVDMKMRVICLEIK